MTHTEKYAHTQPGCFPSWKAAWLRETGRKSLVPDLPSIPTMAAVRAREISLILQTLPISEHSILNKMYVGVKWMQLAILQYLRPPVAIIAYASRTVTSCSEQSIDIFVQDRQLLCGYVRVAMLMPGCAVMRAKEPLTTAQGPI